MQGKCRGSDKVIAAHGLMAPEAPTAQGRNSVAMFPFRECNGFGLSSEGADKKDSV